MIIPLTKKNRFNNGIEVSEFKGDRTVAGLEEFVISSIQGNK